MDQRQEKKVKHVKPALLFVQDRVGGADQLKTLAQSAYAAFDTSEEEEQKNDADVAAKIASIIDYLSAPGNQAAEQMQVDQVSSDTPTQAAEEGV